jgi:hypothetical protein
VALNRYLGGKHADGYAALLTRLRQLPEASWQNGGLPELRQQADALNQRVLGAGGEAYLAPFEDRPDVLLLHGRNRSRPLLV